MSMVTRHATRLHCACCARPFARTSRRGPAPLYCSADCRAQMRIRQRVWNDRIAAAPQPVPSEIPMVRPVVHPTPNPMARAS
jgi:hypothetical protein